jgi:hypothetical protein
MQSFLSNLDESKSLEVATLQVKKKEKEKITMLLIFGSFLSELSFSLLAVKNVC